MTRARNSANLASHGNLFVDITNDRTGIGSVVPGQSLHVAGTAGFHGDVTFTGDLYNTTWDRSDNSLKFVDNAMAKFGDSGDLMIYHHPTNGSLINHFGNNHLVIRSGNRLDLRSANDDSYWARFVENGAAELYHDGNLKFETTAYGTNTTGTAVNDGLVVAGVATVTTMNVTGVLTYDDVTSVDSVGIVTARQGIHIDDSIVHIGDTNTKIRFPANDQVSIETAGSERLRITSGGKIGLGVNATNPSFQLQIHESVNTAYAANATVAQLAVGNVNSSSATNAAGIHLFTDGNGRGVVNLSALNNSTSSSADFVIQTRHSATLAERLRITSTGFMGIGTNSPQRLLHQHISSSDATYHSFTNDTTGSGVHDGVVVGLSGAEEAIFWNYQNTPMRFSTNGSERLRIDSNGNMALGKGSSSSTNYGTNFQIHSNSTSGAALHLTDNTTGGGTGDGFHIISTSGNAYLWQRENAHMIFATNGTERARILSGGNVLIGTTTDSTQKLTLYGTNAAVIYQGANTGTGNAQGFITGNNGNVNGFVWNYENGFIHFGTNNAERLRINSTGDIGINFTGTPAATLDIRTDRDPSNGMMCFLRNNAQNGNGAFYGVDTNSVGSFSFGIPDNTNAFVIVDGLGNSGTERFRIDHNGHTRFGSSGDGFDSAWNHSTYGNTEVAIDSSTGYAVLHFRGEGAGSTATRFSIGCGDDKFYMAYDDVDGRHNIVVNGAGNVGINKNNPTTTLDVNGTVTATLFSGSGASLSSLNGSNIASGTIPVARIGTGTKNTSTFYRGDGTFATVTPPAITAINSASNNRVVTSDGGTTVTAESGLTYDGTTLQLAAADDIRIAGGTWTGEYTGGIKIQPDASNSYFQYHGSMYFRNSGGANRVYFDSAGNTTIVGNLTVNGGISGSGASLTGVNATTLDSIDSGSFLRSDADDNCNARITFLNNENDNHDDMSSTTAYLGGLEVKNTGAGNDAFMAFHAGGDYAFYFGLDADSNSLAVGGWSMGSVKNKIWHAGNDGSGSGLDADTLDGMQPSASNSNNTIVQRNGNGYVFANYFNTTANDTGSGADLTRFYASEDAYIRYIDKASMRSVMNTSAVSGSFGGRETVTSDQNYWVGSMGWGSQNFNTTVWDYGSGFIDVWNNPTGQPSGTSHWQAIQAMHYTNQSGRYGFRIACGAGNPDKLFVQGRWNQTTNGWHKLWNAANDGSGSGLDSDTCDGVHGTSFLRSDTDDTLTKGSMTSYSGALNDWLLRFVNTNSTNDYVYMAHHNYGMHVRNDSSGTGHYLFDVYSSSGNRFQVRGSDARTTLTGSYILQTGLIHFDVKLTTGTSSGDIKFNSVLENVGSHYSTSTGRFTAPVAGVYHFAGTVLQNNSGSQFDVNLRYNNSSNTKGNSMRATFTGHSTIQISETLKMNANDYVHINVSSGSLHHDGSGNWCGFQGTLLG